MYVEADQASNFPYNSYAPRLTSFVGYHISNEVDVPFAFMAVLTANFTPPANDMPIIMDKVITDIGGAYDDLTGSFICPDSKLYMFFLTVVTTGGTRSGIYMDNIIIRFVRSTGTDTESTSGSSTASVIIQCQINSRVQPRHVSLSDRTYFADYTSFSGYQLPGQDA